jgi:cytochrome b6-f complex iron-sulfur subunit
MFVKHLSELNACRNTLSYKQGDFMSSTSKNAPDDQPDILSRRDILKTAAASLILLLPLASAIANPAPEQWTTVGKSEEFVANVPKKVTLADGSVLYVTRQTAATVIAVSSKCTHHGCQVGWKPSETKFECPCHGAAFAATGKNLNGPMRHPQEILPNLATLPTRLMGGEIQVNLAVVPLDQRRPNPES